MNKHNTPNDEGQPLFAVSFEDGSSFVLPTDWEDVFVSYFGADRRKYGDLADRLRFVVGKYLEHRAWPSKFDGIALEDEDALGDSKYDSPDFYAESWEDHWAKVSRLSSVPGAAETPKDTKLHLRTSRPPTWAEIAEDVLYQHMRPGILQKALDEYSRREGGKAPRVVTPEQLLKELEQRKEQ